MQKLLTFFLFSLLASNVGLASTPSNVLSNIFHDDLSRLDSEMTGLSQLEQLVQETYATQTQLVKENNPLAQQLLPNNNLAGSLFASSAPEHERLMDIPGFLWGFCCSFVGVFLVYLSIDDPEAKKKEGRQAIIGCAVGTVLWTGMYVLAIFYASNY